MTLSKADENLYDYVADQIEFYLNHTYYDDCVIEFEQSYDGINWTEEREFVELINSDIIFSRDWNEGQKYIRNLKICHFGQMLFPVLTCYTSDRHEVENG